MIRISARVIAVVMVAVLVGCEKFAALKLTRRGEQRRSAEAEELERAARKTRPLPGTVGAACSIEGLTVMFVNGYGLVGGLAGKGSSQCPDYVRARLRQAAWKHRKMMERKTGRDEPVSVSAIIASPDTAVVRIFGQIPAGAIRGDRFDVMVEALRNTGTISLEGGYLYACDLSIYAERMPAAKTTILARASGPIAMNPFEKKKGRNLLYRRRGYVIGGGIVVKDRRLHLILNQPSYSLANAITQKINNVFGPLGHNPGWRAARPVSSDRIDLRIPQQYRDRKSYFLALVRGLYIRSDPTFLEQRARELANEILDPQANADAISFAWEGMGKVILPLIQSLYASSNLQAAFHSARAGAALEDTLAVERLCRFAVDPDSPYRRKAIAQLGRSRAPVASQTLRKLLDDTDLEVRIAAYNNLVRLGDIAVKRESVGPGNFFLDTVRCESRPLVFVTRTRQPTVALFGRMTIDPPVFYTHSDESIMISADSNATSVTLVRKTPAGTVSDPISASLDLRSLLKLLGNDAAVTEGQVVGLGLPYSHIVAILKVMCDSGAIPAKFQMEEMTISPERTDYFLERPERDESAG